LVASILETLKWFVNKIEGISNSGPFRQKIARLSPNERGGPEDFIMPSRKANLDSVQKIFFTPYYVESQASEREYYGVLLGHRLFSRHFAFRLACHHAHGEPE